VHLKLRLTRRRVVVLVAAVTLIAAGGAAYATIPDSGGVIHGCYSTKDGTLRVIDTDAGQTCGGKEASLDWNQTGPEGPPGPQGGPGPQGPPGPEGSAKAYARINGDGTVNPTFSKGITSANVTHPRTGVYCLRGLGFDPKIVVGNGVAGLRADPVDVVAPAQFDTVITTAVLPLNPDSFLGVCDTALSPTQATVRLYVYAAGGPSAGLVDRPFSILLED
jgi:hypothetical protein